MLFAFISLCWGPNVRLESMAWSAKDHHNPKTADGPLTNIDTPKQHPVLSGLKLEWATALWKADFVFLNSDRRVTASSLGQWHWFKDPWQSLIIKNFGLRFDYILAFLSYNTVSYGINQKKGKHKHFINFCNAMLWPSQTRVDMQTHLYNLEFFVVFGSSFAEIIAVPQISSGLLLSIWSTVRKQYQTVFSLL